MLSNLTWHFRGFCWSPQEVFCPNLSPTARREVKRAMVHGGMARHEPAKLVEFITRCLDSKSSHAHESSRSLDSGCRPMTGSCTTLWPEPRGSGQHARASVDSMSARVFMAEVPCAGVALRREALWSGQKCKPLSCQCLWTSIVGPTGVHDTGICCCFRQLTLY